MNVLPCDKVFKFINDGFHVDWVPWNTRGYKGHEEPNLSSKNIRISGVLKNWIDTD